MSDLTGELRTYLEHVYGYYEACACWRDVHLDITEWGPARALGELVRCVPQLLSAPPWNVQFIPARGLFRITAAYLREVLALSQADYRKVSGGFYQGRRDFYDWTTEATMRVGWDAISSELHGAWSGAVFNAMYKEMLYLFITKDAIETERMVDPTDLGRNDARGFWLETQWEEEALQSLDGRMPLYWVGTDVTALLGGTARLGLSNDRLLVPKDSPGYVDRDPFAREAFEAIVTVLTNSTGLYFEERKENVVGGPLYVLWRDIARKCRAGFQMPKQRVPRRLSNEQRLRLGAEVLKKIAEKKTTENKKEISGKELQLHAEWVAFQVHHENLTHLFWDEERNTMDDLRRSWDACEPLGMEEPLNVMRQRGITVVGEAQKYVPKTWSGERFGVAYLAWSLAKGCGVTAQWRDYLAYCVHRHRLPCVPAGMNSISTERVELLRLFPWGAILQGLEEGLYRETDWLLETLTELRKQTIENLGGLEADLVAIGASKRSTNRKHRLQTEAVHAFAHKYLKEALPGVDRFYPKDRRLEYVEALTAAKHDPDEEGLTAQEQRWLTQARINYQGTYPTTTRDDPQEERHLTVLDYENTIIDAIRTGDNRLEAFLVERGYLST